MKKKILLSVLSLFVLVVFLVKVSAASALGLSQAVQAKTPSTVPNVGDTMYGTVTDAFNAGSTEGNDLRKIIFTTEGNETATGKTNLKKIVIGKIAMNVAKAPDKTTDSEKLAAAFTEWFTAYCLDEYRRYPENGIFASNAYATAAYLYEGVKQYQFDENGQVTGENPNYNETQANEYKQKIIKAILMAAAKNDKNFRELYDVDGYNQFVEISSYTINDTELTQGSLTFASAEDKVLWNMKYNSNLLEYSFDATIREIKLSNTATLAPETTKTVNYNLTVRPIHVIFDEFNVNDSTNVVGSDEYTKALWIIEHTYPSVSIQDALTDAGASYDTLKSQIATIYELSDADEITVATENVVYAVVQYAIWSVTGTSSSGAKYTGVQNSTELDKLLKYLIDPDRVIPSDYATGMSFTNRLSVTEPGKGLEIFKKTDTVYTYGPYSATYDALDGENIAVSVTTEGASAFKIVDADGNEVTEVEPGQEFFVQGPAKAKLGNVKIKLETNITKFTPAGLRGRIYQPIYAFGQNVMSGGSTETVKIDTTFDVLLNAKTGVEDIAVLLLVTLVAFSLGYLVLSFKTKPVALS